MSDFVESRISSYRRLSADVKKRSVAAMREAIPDGAEKDAIRELIDADPDGWIWEHHFFMGMQARNALRRAGVKDDELPPSISDCNKGDRNWDDYYVGVMEVALRSGIWSQLTDEERAEVE